MTGAVRRGIDVGIAVVGLVVLSPLVVVLAIAVKATSPGPVLHRAVRVGRHGQLFPLLKFRTMVVGAAHAGPAVTRSGDPRITPIGRLLRRTKLDELPQLVNVLGGQMSLVGPRPEDPRYVALYDERERHVLDVRPGITGAASLRYRDEEAVLASFESDLEAAYLVVMRDKLKIDLDYLAHRTIRSDLSLVLETLLAVVR